MKKEIKFFSIFDFDQEAAYLTAMHRQGWKLTKVVAGVVFHFEQVKPADVVYQLDFKGNGRRDKEEYYQLYRDYGWEYVLDCNNFVIFRNEVSPEVDDIFSDRESQLRMVMQIFKNRYLVVLGLYLVPVASLYLTAPRFVLGVSLIYLPLLAYVTYGFYRLKKKFH